jgi:hypothetical protein
VNEYLVVWVGNETSTGNNLFVFEIYGQRLAGATGAEVGTNDFRISDMGDDTAFLVAGRSDVAWSVAAGEYLVTWNGDDTVDGENEIYGQRLSASGAEVEINDFRLSNMGPDGDPTYSAINPRVAFGPAGVALVVWQADDDAPGLVDDEVEIYGQRFQIPIPPAADFNADGKTDIVLRNYDTGQNAVWRMNGLAFQGISDLPLLGNTNFRNEGTADFNADGKVDVLWRNYDTGQNAVWRLNGTSLQGISDLPLLMNTSWHFEGTGDFNADGKPDIILRNVVSGQNAIWRMNGTSLQGITDLPLLMNTSWRMEGSADFNADGKPDIVLRNYATGQNAIWRMNGTSLQGVTDLPLLSNTNYRIEGVGDYNGDGKPDLVWRNYGTGQNAIWLMNGTALLGVTDLPLLTNLDWEIAGPK